MSETQNKEIVEKINTAFAEDSTEDFLDNCTEDVVWTMAGEEPVKGKQAIRDWMSSMGGSTEPPSFNIDMVIAEGSNVVCTGDMRMKGADGSEGKYRFCDIYTFTGDKVSDLVAHVTKYKV